MNKLKIVFDYNCLINIENSTMGYKDLIKIVSLHNSGKIQLHIPAISASEYQKGGLIKNFNEFKKYVSSLCIKNANYLCPMGYYNITFCDYSLWVGEKMNILERWIRKILFPNFNFIKEQQQLSKKFRNRLCDVQSIWCHIYHKNDVFITEDKNFRKKIKRKLLIQIGAKNIMTPSEFVKVFKKGTIKIHQVL